MGRSREKIQAGTEEEKTINTQQGSGIRCPECGERSHVLNSVPKPNESVQGRYRECDACGTRFYTEETIMRTTVSAKK